MHHVMDAGVLGFLVPAFQVLDFCIPFIPAFPGFVKLIPEPVQSRFVHFVLLPDEKDRLPDLRQTAKAIKV
jgi:hypothetical protein